MTSVLVDMEYFKTGVKKSVDELTYAIDMQTGSRLDLQTQNYIDAKYLCCNFCPSVSKQISSVNH